MRSHERGRLFFLLLMALLAMPAVMQAQAALLLEEPYGVFGTLNPTGHTALYFARICADTPVRLRRCEPGERGVVISRYSGIGSYDWIAIPLVPYLYAVEEPGQAPTHTTRAEVERMRARYREAHLMDVTRGLDRGGFLHGGWSELIGASYERRIWAFRFATTQEQDDHLIALLNDRPNRTSFNLLFNNCSDFARHLLAEDFPASFGRSLLPDAAITTPKAVAYKLAKRARKHSEMQLSVYELPQIPGYRKHSHANKSISESLVSSSGYAVSLTLMNPYVAGSIGVDYMVNAHRHLLPKNPPLLTATDLTPLYSPHPNEKIAQKAATGDADFTEGPGDVMHTRSLR